MNSRKLHTCTYLWSLVLSLLLLPQTVHADSATPYVPSGISIVLPQAYRVVCDTTPALRPAVLQPYITLLGDVGRRLYQSFFSQYQQDLERTAGTPKHLDSGPEYPIVLAWTHPTNGQKVYLDAYATRSKVAYEFRWELKDQHNPSMNLQRRVYYRHEFFGIGNLETAWEDFLEHNPYPFGTWEVAIHVPGVAHIQGVYASKNGLDFHEDPPRIMIPALRFETTTEALRDCARRTPTSEQYSITKLSDPRLITLLTLTQRVKDIQQRRLQPGALLTYLESKDHSGLTEAVVFVDPKTFAGFLVSKAVATSLQSALTDKDFKRSIDKLYEVVADPSQMLAFTSYEDLSKRFFYREVFSRESVLDPKAELDLREQKGWEQWRKDAERELKSTTAVVDEDGCIRGTWSDGEKFKVCGTRGTGPKGSSKRQTVTFSQKTEKGKKIIGHAKIGQPLHSHRGILLDANNRKVAYIPLQSTSIFRVLPRAITLLVYSLPHDAFQAVADVFSFQGLWDLSKSLVGGAVRRFIGNCFGVGWVNDLYNAVRAVESGYRMGEAFTQFWDRVYDAEDEYELYDAADGARPAVQALIRKAVQDKLVEKAQGKIRELEKAEATGSKPPSTPKQQLALPGPKPPYGLLTTTDLEGLVLSSNEKTPLTEVNAQALLTGPTPASTHEVTVPKDEHGVAIAFRDNGQTVLTREAKSVGETGKAFAKEFEERLEEGAREKGEDGPRELVVQVPPGQDVAGALQHFRKDHEGKKWLEKYKDEPLIVVDPDHNTLYQGPVLGEPQQNKPSKPQQTAQKEQPKAPEKPLGMKEIRERGFPLGFKSRGEFGQFSEAALGGLVRAGFRDAEVAIQGSAVTGRSSETGQAFDLDRLSDLDVSIASPTLLERAKAIGVHIRGSGTETEPLNLNDSKRLGIENLRQTLTRLTGRTVNFKVFVDRSEVVLKGPAMWSRRVK